MKLSTKSDGLLKNIGEVDRFRIMIASGFGSGFLRPASGTWGSALAVILYLPIARLNSPDLWWGWGLFLAATFFVGVWAANVWERLTGEKDSHDIVVDEFVGQWVTLSMFSIWGASVLDWRILIAGFVLFRAFDITKLPPIRRLEKLPGGWGVMIDDVLAGIYACALLHAGVWIFFHLF